MSIGKSVTVAVASVVCATVGVGSGLASSAGASVNTSLSAHAEGSAQAIARVGASTEEIPFLYEVKDLPADTSLHVHYHSGVVETSGGDARATTGGIKEVDFENSDTLLQTGATSLDAEVTAWLTVKSSSITGVAEIPSGTTVTVNNPYTKQTIDLKNGESFSLPTGFNPSS